MTKKYPIALTIAGSDSGGGAGIQADLKTFSANGVYGMSAITALTAQNTLGVNDIRPVPTDFLEKQIRAVLDDIGTNAVKIGMLHSSEVIKTVVRLLREYHVENIVVDPVMVATSGDKLLQDEAIKTLAQELLPEATLITPNIPEAEILLNHKIKNVDELGGAARELAFAGNKSVVIKAGNRDDDTLVDV
ncbi:MAG: bifunctional hydroxymethylpyrimidine kinase/phosphomethylpyrimidine kinase, partial [Bacteroidales bacterium]|nr:bifunctional hydroxymethylpyrimidine kinase/phosphomethylpyrimidine kinase [Bacteroidales bacterium]